MLPYKSKGTFEWEDENVSLGKMKFSKGKIIFSQGKSPGWDLAGEKFLARRFFCIFVMVLFWTPTYKFT
jgi:hypothetical protein